MTKYAFLLLSKAADQGYIPAIRTLATRYAGELNDGTEHNFPLAMKLLKQCVDANYTPALILMGKSYLDGRNSKGGIHKDTVEAVRFFRLAANAGSSEAMYELGLCYRHGYGGLEANSEECMRLLTLSAEGHNSKAQYILANSYEQSDPIKAKIYHQKAADQGYKRSQLKLASIYLSEGGAEDEGDYDKAYTLILSAYTASQTKKTSSSSYSKTCLMMGWCHLNGYGCELNEDKAIKYYEQAIDRHSSNCPRIAFGQERKLWIVASIKSRPKIISHMIKKNGSTPNQLQTIEAQHGFAQAAAELGLDFTRIYRQQIQGTQQLPIAILLEHDIILLWFIKDQQLLQNIFRQMLITGGDDAAFLQHFRLCLDHGLHFIMNSQQQLYFPSNSWSKDKDQRKKQIDMIMILLELDVKITREPFDGIELTLENLQAEADAAEEGVASEQQASSLQSS